MKKLLVTLSIVLLMFMFVSCGGDTPAPSYPDTGTDEPTEPVEPDPEPEPEPEPREFIPLYGNYKWVGIRKDSTLDKEYKIELVPYTSGWKPVAFDTGYSQYMGGYSNSYIYDFFEQVFDLDNWEDYQSATEDYLFHVYYHDEEAVMNPDTLEYDYYPYYISFVVGFDLCTPIMPEANPHIYNRFVYATYANEYDLFEGQTEEFRLTLVPTGTDEQNKYFTEEIKNSILERWYETIFQGLWAGQNGIGVGMVNLVEGPTDNPEKIEFTFDMDIPDVPGGEFEKLFPSALFNIGELTREPIAQN